MSKVVWLLIFLSSIAFGQSLKYSKSIQLPGPVGRRFDYLRVDYKNGFVYVAHLGANQVYVVDSTNGKFVRTILDTPGVEGIEYATDLQKIYTSNWKDPSIGVIDLKTMKVVKKITAEKKPDGSAYVEEFHKLYVSDEEAKALIVIDVKSEQVIKTLRFEGETGMPQYDPIGKKIYLNLQDQNLLAVINPVNDTIENKFPIDKCKGNHGLALDPKLGLAFLGCDGNDLLSIFDLNTHKSVTNFPIPSGVDVVAYDPGLKRVYAACYSGAISVLQVDDGFHFHKIDDFKVPPKTHSLAVNFENHKIFVPEQEVDGKPTSTLVIFDAIIETNKEKTK